MPVLDGIGDGPVELPLLAVGPLVAVFVSQKRVLESAAKAATEVHDRGGSGNGVVEVADCVGVWCVLGDPPDSLGVLAPDFGGCEGGGEDVDLVCREWRRVTR